METEAVLNDCLLGPVTLKKGSSMKLKNRMMMKMKIYPFSRRRSMARKITKSLYSVNTGKDVMPIVTVRLRALVSVQSNYNSNI
jgi:hypothetical protein